MTRLRCPSPYQDAIAALYDGYAHVPLWAADLYFRTRWGISVREAAGIMRAVRQFDRSRDAHAI